MKKVFAISVFQLLLLANTSLAGNVDAGRAASASCSGCHGVNGISANPLWPNLAGQKSAYLVKQLRAFRDGSRADPMMTQMARPLSDADIENLAAYYANLK